MGKTRTAKRRRAGEADWLDRYLADSRDLATSFLCIAPILLAYEIGLVLTRSRYQNAIDLIVKAPLYKVFGPNAFLVFNALVLFGAGFLAGRLAERRRLRAEVLVGIALEGLIYAVLLGRGIAAALSGVGLSIGPPGAALGIVLALGAGVYEEIFFRLALLEALEYVLGRFVGLGPNPAAALAVLLGSLLFSAAHYVGASPSWTLDLYGFSFRFVAGLVLATIYRVRGLAVAVYTHAFYDCLIALSP